MGANPVGVLNELIPVSQISNPATVSAVAVD